MSRALRRALVAVFAVGTACAVAIVAIGLLASREPASRRLPPADIPPGRPGADFTDDARFDDGGFAVAAEFTGPIHESASLPQLREAVELRGRLGLAVLRAEVDGVKLGFRAPREEIARVVMLRHQIGLLNLYEGRYAEAAAWFRTRARTGPSS